MNYAFVTPRYGPDIVGGAETLARAFAERLAADGHGVEVFTTRATDSVSLANDKPAGVEAINGVRVERFTIAPAGDPDRAYTLAQRLSLGASLSADQQFALMDQAHHAPRLYAALANKAASFDAIFALPYPFAMVQYALATAGARGFAWPCLHNEAEAFALPVQVMLRAARGVFFNSEAERDFARDRLEFDSPRGHVIGMGIAPAHGDAARFRRELGIADPFVLYAGRIDPHKNVPMLLDAFARYKASQPGPLKLVLMGANSGVDTRRADVIEIGFQPETRKHDAFAAALALCQPSLHESFSIVLMEAWQQGRPVLVHERCDVTRDYARLSGGGLAFGDGATFARALDALVASPEHAAALGAAGQRFVETNYRWPVVLARFDAAVRDCLARPPEVAS
jgi:glycosyltransferase involved in cell wall biosynthesis